LFLLVVYSRISGVMGSVSASSGFEPQLGQTKEYKIWGDMSIRGLLF